MGSKFAGDMAMGKNLPCELYVNDTTWWDKKNAEMWYRNN